ncbi:MAG TPA: protein-glutamate O-methyltransferase CheR [Rhizomicrobium sp.]|jgi:chemotaxis protein methyltransferase CheR|nr:protein-glutamate O-methyltransferase CheR [Rhizomicrobium sp.]
MKQDDIDFLARMLRRRSGLALVNPKPDQIENRLAPVMRRFGFRDVDSMISELRHGRDAMARAITEAMTTNESSFFRDPASFEAFRDAVLPDLLRRRAATRRLRIWSAACAAGQEPYSIAILLDELRLRAEGWTIDIVATDISTDMIERAERGLYSRFEIRRGLDVRRVIENFVQERDSWQISEPLRRMVTFRRFNLLDSFGWLDDIDVVFCRNVLMYFDQRTKAGVLDKISEVLPSDGYLVLGPVETTQGLSAEYAAAEAAPGIYRKAQRAVPRALSA